MRAGEARTQTQAGDLSQDREMCRALGHGAGYLLPMASQAGKFLLAVYWELLHVARLAFSWYSDPGSSDFSCGSWHPSSTKIEASRHFSGLWDPEIAWLPFHCILLLLLKLTTGRVEIQGERSTQECELWGRVHCGLQNIVILITMFPANLLNA